jgi:hypothetical protein
MHIRAGAKSSVGFVIFKEKLFPETLDLQTSRFPKQNRCPRMSESGQMRRFDPVQATSGLPRSTDIITTGPPGPVSAPS